MFPLSSIIEVYVYFHEFHQKPTTLDGDGIVISTAHLMSEQWHVSAISVKSVSREVPQTKTDVWMQSPWVVQSNYYQQSVGSIDLRQYGWRREPERMQTEKELQDFRFLSKSKPIANQR